MHLTQTIVVIDIETTGLDPEADSIIEVGAVRLADGEIVDQFQSLVYFGGRLSRFVRSLTGITSAELRQAPAWEQVRPQLEDFMKGAVLAAHNADFDCRFLAAAGCTVPEKVVDTLDLARVFFPGFPDHSLEYLSEKLLDTSSGHRALADAKAAAGLVNHFYRRITRLKGGLLHQIIKLAPKEWGGTAFFKLAAAELLWQNEEQDRRQEEKLPSTPPICSESMLEEMDLGALFADGGMVSRVVPGYQFRSQQVCMAEKIWAALAEAGHLVVEAETGTGKTMAYLLPAAIWALGAGERVVVSTNTLSLQQQLWQKDLPLLASALPGEFRYCLLKGRANYLCRRRLNLLLAQGEQLSEPMRLFLITVLLWQERTETGDKSELNVNRRNREHWLRLAADGENCWGNACSWFNTCFVSRAKRKAAGAHIIVANHSLVLADAFSGYQVLPEFAHLVVDEAQHFEETAAKQLGTYIMVSVLDKLAGELKQIKPPPAFAALFPHNILQKLGEIGRDMSKDIEITAALTLTRLESGQDENSLRITPAVRKESFWQDWCRHVLRLSDRLRMGAELIDEVERQILDLGLESEAWQKELQSLQERMAAFRTGLEMMAGEDDKDYVTWFERQGTAGVMFNRQPIDVAPLLQDFYAKMQTMVFTSATITINQNFKFFSRNLGLDSLEPDYLSVNSPFCYAKQALLCLPDNVPPANQGGFLESVLPFMEDVLSYLQGSTLVLFTSHQMLRDCYYRLKPLAGQLGIRLMAQGIDGDRWQLVEHLKERSDTVVFGAQSFWEGVDVPGNNLRCVIIMRLPFLPPSDPALAARLELLEEQQRNSFYHLSLPLAILRFKQGVGRLIRSTTDRGVVIVLDSRITKKRYGQYFLNSVPEFKVLKTTTKGTLQAMREFLTSISEDIS